MYAHAILYSRYFHLIMRFFIEWKVGGIPEELLTEKNPLAEAGIFSHALGGVLKTMF